MSEAELAKTSCARLPDDSELLGSLERSVEDVFGGLSGIRETLARFESRRPAESIDTGGAVELLLAQTPDLRVRVQREAVVEFRGPLDGRFALRASEAGAMAIARGLLLSGPDDQLTVEELEDALKECANQLMARIKSQVLDLYGAFSISVPFMRGGPRECVDAACCALGLRIGDGLVAIEISRRPKPALPSKA